MTCDHKYYKTVKENENSVAHHKCVCADCGEELHPVSLKPCVVEVFSRVTGFFRPVRDWNVGKQEEFKDRKKFNIDKAQ